MRKIFTLLIAVIVFAFAAFAVSPPSKAQTNPASSVQFEIAHTQFSPVKTEVTAAQYSPPLSINRKTESSEYQPTKTRQEFAHNVFYPPEQLE